MSFNPIFSNQPLPVTFTEPEAIFIAFAQRDLIAGVTNRSHLVAIGSENASGMQTDFFIFTAKTFPRCNLTTAQLDVVSLVNSVWQKSRIFVDYHLNLSRNAIELEDQNSLLELAKTQEEDLAIEGFKGKLFTQRQAHLLLSILTSMANSGGSLS